MTTQYSPILKLALPVTGELSGTWGDIVNDNITSMVEQAIAGLAAIDSWAANAHTLTTADGTTSESRCAMLVLTDTGGSLTGAATVICPTDSKIYIVKNASGETATIKTSAGTGVAIPTGETSFVFCDGTNVVQAVTRLEGADIDFAKLKGTGAVVVTNILDEDDMASDSPTALATQQSIKAYVDSQIAANNDLSEVLANGNTTGGTDIAVSAGDDITFADTSKAIFGAGADLSIYHDGTTSKIDGNVSVTNALTLTAGTANGVAYLNGSKVLTTGSALTFDGAILGVNGVSVGRGAGAVATNTAVGANAFASNTTGSRNLAIGYYSLNANTTGSDQTSVGQGALEANTTGIENSALGSRALRFNTTGNYNSAFGRDALFSNTTASNNTAVGYQAGYSNTTGSGILAIGYQAGYSNTTGNGNTAIGNGNAFTGAALYSNASGNNNVAVGSGSLFTTTSSNNTAVGYEAAKLTTSGASNVALGTQALFSNTTASNNTAVGYQAGYSNTTGADNVAVGRIALATNQTGTLNTAIGSAALNNNTASNNTAVGYVALYVNSTGSNNTAIGVSALQSNTTASNNTAVGYQAGYGNTEGTITALGYLAGYGQTTGTLNTFLGMEQGSFNTVTGGSNSGVGHRALLKISSGSYNTAIGQEALRENTSASTNNAFGYQAGYSNSTGTLDVFGYQAGYGNTTGTYNVAMGYKALTTNSTGSYNTAIGQQALQLNTTASYNTAVGYQAGYSNQTAAGKTTLGAYSGYLSTAGGYSTFVGYAAGYNSTGSGNTFIGTSAAGAGAGEVVTSGSKNTILGGYNGNQGGLDIRTASNYIVLSDGDGNPKGGWDGSGNFHSGEWSHADGSMFYSILTALNAYRGTAVAGSGILGLYSDVGGTKTVRAYFTADGGLANYSANDTNLSDERLKKDIVLAGNYLGKICAIPVKNFRYKDQDEAEDITLGVIAQDVLAVAPELVSQKGFGLESEEDYLSIYQTDLQYALMKAIQELKAEFDAYKATHP